MFYIEGSNIYLTRGDTLILNIEMYNGNTPYVPVDGETVRFALKSNYEDPDEDVLINKDIDIETMQLTILPQETKELKMGRKYVYDIEFTDINGNVDTFIKGIFYLGEEVL